MADFSNQTVTVAGRKMLSRSVTEQKPIHFRKIAIGDGTAPDDPENLTALVHQLFELPVGQVCNMPDEPGAWCVSTSFVATADKGDFFCREAGIYATFEGEDDTPENRVLFAYLNAGDTADFIRSVSAKSKTQIDLNFSIVLGSAEVLYVFDPDCPLTLRALKDLHDHINGELRDTLNKVDEKVQGLEDSVNARADALETDLTARVDKLERDVNARADALDKTLTKRVDDLEASVTGTVTQFTAEITEKVNGLESDCSNFHSTTKKRVDDLEALFNRRADTLESDVNARADALEDEMRKNMADLTREVDESIKNFTTESLEELKQKQQELKDGMDEAIRKLEAADQGYVLKAGDTMTGTLTLSKGNIAVTTGNISAPAGTLTVKGVTSNGAVNISTGNLTLTAGSISAPQGSISAKGPLTITGGNISASGSLTAAGITSSAAVTITSGDLTLTAGNIKAAAGSLTVKGISSSAAVNITAGNLSLTSGSISAPKGSISAKGPLTLSEGGITVTKGDLTLTAGNLKAAAGSLTCNGITTTAGVNVTGGIVASGTVTAKGNVSGASLTATTGGITVTAGNITASQSAISAKGPLTLSDGNLVLTKGSISAPAGSITAKGPLSLTGGGITVATGGITVTSGNITLQNGTLNGSATKWDGWTVYSGISAFSLATNSATVPQIIAKMANKSVLYCLIPSANANMPETAGMLEIHRIDSTIVNCLFTSVTGNSYVGAYYNSAFTGWRSTSPVPAGMGGEYYGSGSTPPLGWLFCEGQTLKKASYPALFSALQYTWGGSGDNFRLPDTRGQFLRGWDNSRGLDPNRKFATDQQSGVPNLKGTIVGATYSSHDFSPISPPFYYDPMDYNMPMGGGGGQIGAILKMDASKSSTVYQTGLTEARPRNLAVRYMLKY